MSGYDNLFALRALNEENINEIEEFARNVMQDVLPENVNMEDYYGVYKKNPSKFQILPGHKHLLKGIAEYLFNKKVEVAMPPVRHESKKPQPRSGRKSNTLVAVENVPDEEKVLRNKLKTWCEKESDEVSRALLSMWDNVSIQVTVQETGDKTSTVANLLCPVCPDPTKNMLKLFKYGTTWCISNFQRHVRGHAANNVSRKPSKGPILREGVSIRSSGMDKYIVQSKSSENSDVEVVLHESSLASTSTTNTNNFTCGGSLLGKRTHDEDAGENSDTNEDF